MGRSGSVVSTLRIVLRGRSICMDDFFTMEEVRLRLEFAIQKSSDLDICMLFGGQGVIVNGNSFDLLSHW